MHPLSPGILAAALVGSAFAAAPSAQAPVLDAPEVAAYLAARDWQRQLEEVAQAPRVFAPDTNPCYLGFDADGNAQAGREHSFHRDWASVLVLAPSRSALHQRRLVMANSLGQVFLGHAPADAENWSATIATVAAAGAPERLDNMLLQSGQSHDGTRWQRMTALEGDVWRPHRLRFLRQDGGSFEGFEFTVGSPRLRWHPGWAPLDADDAADGDAVAMNGMVVPVAAGEGKFVGRGVAARNLQVSVSHKARTAVLLPGSVRTVRGELLVVLPKDAMALAGRLDDQAWAVEALRQLAEFQLAAKTRAVIDADADGVGEFGEPGLVVPQRRRTYRPAGPGRYFLRGHLFAVHLPPDIDGREQRFTAYAWPAEAVDRRDLAFAVDQRGIVHSCSAHERFAGHDAAPGADAFADARLAWRPLH